MGITRILHFSLANDIGGIEKFLLDVWNCMDHTEITFDFITDYEHPAFHDEFISSGCKIFHLPSRVKHPVQFRQGLERVIMENGYDIIHVHKNSCADMSVFEVCNKLNVKCVIAHSHNTSNASGRKIYNLLHYINRPRIRRLSHVKFACSERAGEWMFGKRACDTGKINVIKPSIDVNSFKFNTEIRARVREAMGLRDKFVVGHVGRLSYQKNHKFLFEILLELYKRNQNVVLLLIGEGEMRAELERTVTDLGLSGLVRFLGMRKDTNELYQAMDVFVFPSLYEGFGLVGVEAQTAGLPCVVSDEVPTNVVLTDTCIQLPLDIGPAKWAEAILLDNGIRQDHSVEISNKGYDINETADILTGYYRNALMLSKT